MNAFSFKFGLKSIGGWLSIFCILLSQSYAIIIEGDPADGIIRFDNGTTSTGDLKHAFGHRGSGTELVTSIYLFELPDLSAGDVNNASLQFSLLDRVGSFITNPAHADVWGLGYVSAAILNTNWHLLGNTDTRTGNDLGTGIGVNTVQKLSDNFLTDESNNPAPGSYRQAVASPTVADFIALLYDEGAVAGDYAVIRINIDALGSSGERGFDIASADAVASDTRPTLSINENELLLYDGFDDGDRTEGSDPRDTDWFKLSSGLTFSVLDDTGGIGDGNALYVQMANTSGNKFLCDFPAVTLAAPGDFIQMSCNFRPTFVAGADEKFRMGIFSSGGTPVAGDVTVAPNNYEGNMVRMSTGAFGDVSLVGVFPGSFLSTPSDFLSRNSNALPITAPDAYSLRYTITRSSTNQMITRVELSKAGSAVVLNGMDPGTDNDLADLIFYDTFDALGMGVGSSGDAVDFFLDNVRVETSVNGVQPHIEVITNVLQLAVDTVPEKEYGMDTVTDLGTNNWLDSGYVLSGDGSVLSLYDPAPAETNKFYRLHLKPSEKEALFTEDLSAFNAFVDLGDGVIDGAVVTNAMSGACSFGTGNALRMFDFNSADRPELQGELSDPVLGPFLISFQSCNQSTSTNPYPAIRWRMGNFGQSQTSAGRAAFSLSWHADLSFSASYRSSPSTVSSLVSPPQPAGVHDIVLIGNGSVSTNYSYSLFGQSRTLNPLSYDVYLDEALFNSDPGFSGGLGFSTNNSLANYDPALGLRRFGLLGSSASDTGPDVWFDNILLEAGSLPEAFSIEGIAAGTATGFSYGSTNGSLYALQSTTNPPAPIAVWQDTGMELIGNGTIQLLFDPGGFTTNNSYRVIEKP